MIPGYTVVTEEALFDMTGSFVGQHETVAIQDN